MSSNDTNLPGDTFPPLRDDTTPGPLPLVPPPGQAVPQPAPALSFPPHPGFWWALLWCLGVLLLTQVPAGLAAAVLMIAVLLVRAGRGGKLDEVLANLADDPTLSFVIGFALVLAHFLMIVFSWLALRIVAGADWRRQVALRTPRPAHVLLVVALTPAFIVLAQAVFRGVQWLGFPSMLEKPNNIPGVACFLASLFTALGLAGVVCLLLRLTLGEHWGRRLFPSWAAPAPVAVSLVMVVNFVIVTAWLYRTWLPGFQSALGAVAAANNQAGMTDMTDIFKNWPIVLAVLVIGVMPGLSEELFCRAFLGRGLLATHGYLWGVLLTSFLFGLLHLDPCQGTMALVLGVVLHLVYLWGRSLLLPMLLHFLNNSIEVILSHVPAVKNLDKAWEVQPPWLLLVAAAALMVAVCLALYQSRARLVRLGEPAWQPPYPGVACPPAGSNTAVESPPLHPGLAGLVLLTLAGFAAALAYSLPWRG